MDWCAIAWLQLRDASCKKLSTGWAFLMRGGQGRQLALLLAWPHLLSVPPPGWQRRRMVGGGQGRMPVDQGGIGRQQTKGHTGI
jgi:hypothetical protein